MKFLEQFLQSYSKDNHLNNCAVLKRYFFWHYHNVTELALPL